MRSSTRDQAEGLFRKIKGTIKKIAGTVGNNPELAEEGRNGQMTGTIQKKIGEIEKIVGKQGVIPCACTNLSPYFGLHQKPYRLSILRNTGGV